MSMPDLAGVCVDALAFAEHLRAGTASGNGFEADRHPGYSISKPILDNGGQSLWKRFEIGARRGIPHFRHVVKVRNTPRTISCRLGHS